MILVPVHPTSGRPRQPRCLSWKREDVAAHFGHRQEASHMVRDAAQNPLVPITGEIP